MASFYEYSEICEENEKIFSAGLYSPLSVPRLVRIENSSILFSAPHAVMHVREGNPKLPDRGTGGLALSLNEIAKVSCLVETSGDGDPAWQDEHHFKEQLLLADPKIVLDLHGMRDGDGPAIDIGLGKSPGDRDISMSELLVHRFNNVGIETAVGYRFKAENPNTITSWAQAKGMNAIQIEIASKYRVPNGNSQNINTLIEALLLFIADCLKLD